MTATLEVVAGGATRRAQVAVVVRPPADAYLELRPDGFKALLFASGQPAQWLPKGAIAPTALPGFTSLADSDFTAEDIGPFRVADYKDARITDDAGGELTVSLFPAASQYSLVVMTFDRTKKVPVKALYYRDTLSNLVKMRTDDGYVQVGTTWLPTSVSMETFKLRTRSALTVRWNANPTVPAELFDPAALPKSPGIIPPRQQARILECGAIAPLSMVGCSGSAPHPKRRWRGALQGASRHCGLSRTGCGAGSFRRGRRPLTPSASAHRSPLPAG